MHTVVPGETIQTIAKAHGFRQWRRVLHHPTNSQLREGRPNPEVLAPGDHVFVPEREPKSEPAHVDEETVFVLAPTRRELVLSLQGAGWASGAGTPYSLSIEGTENEGIVDSQGRAQHDIAIDARQASLVLELDDDVPAAIELDIGALDPVETEQGVRARLYNLGVVHATGDVRARDGAAGMTQFRECSGLSRLDEPLSAGAREDLLFAHGS